ncbi:O-antigen ligase family protein (plasmid) [Pseudobutyrivibrio xylanivorans]|uniref:O-antigen ligase family protein n=2 Tax=Pseudobutyrivibrio xylanivorans TaxID=185007 RepID=A0A5P6VW44_PSEXY|nr:O-antigen ligase family protein [Pseudobutyrivibrio xylanivorans]
MGWDGRIFPGAAYYANRILYVVSICVLLYINKEKRKYFSLILPLMMASVIAFFNNADIANNYTISAWSCCFIMLFYCAGNNFNRWHDFFLKSLSAIGAFYAFTTLLAMVDSHFFMNVCIPFFAGYGYSNQMISLYNQGYITGFSPHYSTTAIYLAVTFGAPLAYGFATNFKNKKMNILAVAIFVSVLVTGKRGHTIFIIAAAMVIYLLVHCDEPVRRWVKIIIIIVVAAVILYIAAQFVPQLMNVVNRFIETKEAGDIEMGRGQTRAVALEVWRQHPFFGIGWNAFLYFYAGIIGKKLNVHCVYAQLLCETGIIGSLPFFFFSFPLL